MRTVLIALVVAVGCAACGGCGPGKLPNDPPPPPQDSGADKGSTAPRPIAPKKQ